MRFVIAGASGFLGTRLTQSLSGDGHDVVRLVRRPVSGGDESRWDPAAGQVDRDVLAAADVVVNLAGAPLIGNVHSQRWRRDVRSSRVTTPAARSRASTTCGCVPKAHRRERESSRR